MGLTRWKSQVGHFLVNIGHVGEMSEVPGQLSLYSMIPLGMELNSILPHVLVLLNGLHQTILLGNRLVDDGCTCRGANGQFGSLKTMLLCGLIWLRETYTRTHKENSTYVFAVQSLNKP